MQQSASEHGDACVNSVQDRGSTPLASMKRPRESGVFLLKMSGLGILELLFGVMRCNVDTVQDTAQKKRIVP